MDEDGRNAEFSEYVATRWTRLLRAAVLLGCSPAEAEDVVQTALTRCLVNWSKVCSAVDRDAYVHRVLFNSFTSGRRRRWMGERPVAELPEPADAGDGAATAAYDEFDAMRRALQQLTADHRTVVVLRYYAHLGEAQMAEVLGIAPGTVKSRLSRALKLLAADPHLSVLRGTP